MTAACLSLGALRLFSMEVCMLFAYLGIGVVVYVLAVLVLDDSMSPEDMAIPDSGER